MAETPVTPANETIVCLLGELKIDKEQVSVGVAYTKKETTTDTLVQLDKPAPLGNALTVGTWLNDSWSTKVDALLVKPLQGDKVGSQADVKAADVEAHLKKLGYPDQVVPLLAKLFTTQIVITDLYVRLWNEKVDNKAVSKKAFKFGIAVDFATGEDKQGLNVFGDIYLQNVKFGILNAPKDYDFEANKLVLPPLRLLDYKEAKKEAEKKVEGESVS
ncbi:MAG: hypothetical protein ACREFP_22545 [Acetobacteraceae bacterium]